MGNVDFRDAMGRHWNDAEQLFAEGRLPNAGQLYGFAAECGLKTLLIANGLPTDPSSGDLVGPQRTNPYMKHIDGLVATVANFPNADRSFYDALAAMPSLPSFSNWSVDQRYWGSDKLAGLQEAWRRAAREVVAALQESPPSGARGGQS